MQNKNSKAFTLVELIVVIVILAILGTIAFISLQGYSATARDSRRISDINNIKTSLELFQINTGEYPIPDEWEPVTYGGDVLRTQGIIGDNVTKNLSKNLNKKLLDPLLEIPYIYSTTSTKKEYQILVLYEKNLTREDKIEGITKVNAKYNLTPKLLGTYNELYVKSQHYIVPTPSIINAEITGTGLELGEETIKSQMITSGENMLDINSQVITNTGKLDINFSYTGTITKDSTVSQKLAVINTIQSAYSGTSLSNDGIYKYVLNQSSNIDKINFIEKTVLTNNGKINIEITNGLCGEDNEKDLSSTPTNLCSKGIATTVVDKGVGDNYEWICQTPDFGEDVNCRANHVLVVNGECGSDNGVGKYVEPTNLCTNGTAGSVTDGGVGNNYSWNCSGTNGGTTASCTALHLAIINGTCGSSNGQGFSSEPTTNLCATGTAGSVTDSGLGGNYTWNCSGTPIYGTNISCSANHISSIVKFSLGGNHTCGITIDGDLVCWGWNGYGQLGDGTLTTRTTPTVILSGTKFSDVSAGSSYTCGITTSGDLMCWGYNNNGQLGDGTTTQRNSPVTILSGTTFSSVSAGHDHTCGITTSGVLKCWGYNYRGMVGDGTTTQRNSPVTILSGTTFSSVSAGNPHTCGITTSGVLKCWGVNNYGQLGDGTNNGSATPITISSGTTFSSVGVSDRHTCGITTSGVLKCWGRNQYGELGNSTTTNSLTPITILSGTTFLSTKVNNQNTCGITTSGVLKSWGYNNYGQLGNGTTTNSSTPITVLSGTTFSSIEVGYTHTCGITTNGILKCWGLNSSGQLGDGTTIDKLSPTTIFY